MQMLDTIPEAIEAVRNGEVIIVVMIEKTKEISLWLLDMLRQRS